MRLVPAQDIVTLQNPFNFLQRDSDVEGMSDGFDNGTAYGAVDSPVVAMSSSSTTSSC